MRLVVWLLPSLAAVVLAAGDEPKYVVHVTITTTRTASE